MIILISVLVAAFAHSTAASISFCSLRISGGGLGAFIGATFMAVSGRRLNPTASVFLISSRFFGNTSPLRDSLSNLMKMTAQPPFKR